MVFEAAAEGFSTSWCFLVVAFNLSAMVILVGFWHIMMYGGQREDKAMGVLAQFKINQENQYGPALASTVNHLRREMFLQTLGWLQAAALQCLVIRLYATRAIGNLAYEPFFAAKGLAHPSTLWNVASVLFVTFWREIHFYFCHRGIHPWSDEGKASGGRRAPWWDAGSFLYYHAHSWHHKSVNPGPWSGMSMHPIEHFLYFSCAWLPFLALAVPSLAVHPMHFLYCIMHACVSPIGGHDGYSSPGGSGYHYLHHAYFECNYGVPWPFNFDRLFGSWVDFDWAEKSRSAGGKISLARAKLYGRLLAELGNDEAAQAAIKKQM